jgi:hypothetical protein
MAIEIVGLPVYPLKRVIFHSYVSLLEGNVWKVTFLKGHVRESWFFNHGAIGMDYPQVS